MALNLEAPIPQEHLWSLASWEGRKRSLLYAVEVYTYDWGQDWLTLYLEYRNLDCHTGHLIQQMEIRTTGNQVQKNYMSISVKCLCPFYIPLWRDFSEITKTGCRICRHTSSPSCVILEYQCSTQIPLNHYYTLLSTPRFEVFLTGRTRSSLEEKECSQATGAFLPAKAEGWKYLGVRVHLDQT